MVFASCKCTESSTLVYMHAIIAIYSLLRATPINLQLLQKFYSCNMPGNIHVQQTYSLHETTSTYTSHVLVSASLQVATPTNPWRYLLAYREYTLLGTWNALLTQLLSVFHSLPIRVTSRSDPVWVAGSSGSAVVTRFQRWCFSCYSLLTMVWNQFNIAKIEVLWLLSHIEIWGEHFTSGFFVMAWWLQRCFSCYSLLILLLRLGEQIKSIMELNVHECFWAL